LVRAAHSWKEFYAFLDTAFPRYNETPPLPFDDTTAMEAADLPRISDRTTA
jgi:hypothetical protein